LLQALDGKVWLQSWEDVEVVYTSAEHHVRELALRSYMSAQNIEIDRSVKDEARVVVQWDTVRYGS
jgi:hypothetical protein